MFPVDVVDVIRNGLAADRRPPDGKLHPSGDLIGSLRHSMLKVAGAPTVESDFISDVRLRTGTMWHQYIEGLLHRQDIKFRSEVRLDKWMPEGWSGTADWLFYDPQIRAWMLGDLKTCKGEAIQYLLRDGAKPEHLWQMSAYWHAVAESGVRLVEEFAVLNLPMNTVPREDIQPLLIRCNPLDKELVVGRMEERWAATQEYLDSLAVDMFGHPGQDLERYRTPQLAPVQAREQRVLWNKAQNVFDLKLVPHYSTQWCPFPDELCDCSTQSVTKVGHYTLDGTYLPRKDYDNVIPLIEPEPRDYRLKREAA